MPTVSYQPHPDGRLSSQNPPDLGELEVAILDE